MFQHFDLMTINVDIANGDPRVGFQLFQELSEASVPLPCPDGIAPQPCEKWFSTTKSVVHSFFQSADRDGRVR
jgi:hypothetical protein